jgi:hypothetical protein
MVADGDRRASSSAFDPRALYPIKEHHERSNPRIEADLVVASCALAGCGGGEKEQAALRMNRPPEMPPAAPAQATIAIDPGPARAAKQEIATAAVQ